MTMAGLAEYKKSPGPSENETSFSTLFSVMGMPASQPALLQLQRPWRCWENKTESGFDWTVWNSVW